MTLLQGRRVWIGGVGVGLELVVVAAVALGVARAIWVVPLLVGLGLLVFAVLVGEPGPDKATDSAQTAQGGSGDGNVRGNVFGNNATINLTGRTLQPTPVAGRSMVRIPIADLFAFYEDHTQVQAERLVESYIGGWMTVKGVVLDVARVPEESHRVSIKVDQTGEFVFAEFPESVQEELPRLRRNDPIEVVGRVATIRSDWLGLEECEFLD